MSPRFLLILPFLLCSPVFPQMDERMELVFRRFEDNVAKADAILDLQWLQVARAYDQALERLVDVARSEGDLDFFTAVGAEQKRFAEQRTPQETFSEFPRLQQLQAQLLQPYQRLQLARAKQILQLAQEVDGQLEAFQRQLVQQNEIDAALQLREQRRAFQEEEPVRGARLLVEATQTPDPPPPFAFPPNDAEW